MTPQKAPLTRETSPEPASLAPKTPSPVKAKTVSRTLEKMRANDRGNWTIKDFETACKQIGLRCSPPTNGSHYKISSEHLDGILPVPAKRPVKRWYVKDFIKLADAHINAIQTEKADG